LRDESLPINGRRAKRRFLHRRARGGGIIKRLYFTLARLSAASIWRGAFSFHRLRVRA
jgi:hypothetical protein